MCKNCVKQQYPQRGRLCSESGAYLANFTGCCVCQGNINIDNQRISKNVLREIRRQTIDAGQDSDEDEDKELIKFDHACIQCNHVVANHLHEFWVEDGYQEYRMECTLCGVAQDSISVMPKDPNKMVSHF